MAGARRISTEERATATDAGAEFLEYNADLNYDADTEEALHKLRDTLAGTESKGTMWVYRLPTDEKGEVVGNAKPTMLFNSALDRYELEELTTVLRRDYMKPGERAVFRVTATMRGQQGMKLNRLVILQRENMEAPNPQGQQRESFAEVVRLIQETNAAAAERTERLMTAMASRVHAVPAVDPIEQAMKMMAAMTGLTQSLVSRAVGVAPGATVDPMAQLQSTILVMKQMKSFLGDSSGGEDSDPDSLASILRAAGPIVGTVGQLLQRSAAPPLARRRIALSNVPTPRPGAPMPAMSAEQIQVAQKTEEVKRMLAQIRPQLEALVKTAADGGNPQAVAPLVLQAFTADSPEEAQFVDFLAREDWWTLLVGVYPPASPHEAWFAQLRVAILGEFDSEESPA